jgi:hypothetical protein
MNVGSLEFFPPKNKEFSVNLINRLRLYRNSSVSYIQSHEKFPWGGEEH